MCQVRGRIVGAALVLMVFVFCVWACKKADESVDPKAAAIWHKYEILFVRGVNGNQGNNEFDEACLFFEQTTGLTMHVNDSTLGVFPTPETSQDLVRIRAWYKVNKNRLYWDKSTHAVKVRPEAVKAPVNEESRKKSS